MPLSALSTRRSLKSLLLTWLAIIIMASPAAADDWEAGKQAFAAADYGTALGHFRAARDAGLDSAAVHYNIAVTHYRLGDFEAAGEAFGLVARRFPAMRGLAEYNLGLVAQRLGDTDAAQLHFRRAYDLAQDNPKLRTLAAAGLADTPAASRSGSHWIGAFGFNVGNDSNVALRDEAGLPTGTTTDSALVDLFASISGPWRRASGLRLEASAYAVRYGDASEFDQTELSGSAFYDWRPGDWRLQAGFQFSVGSLGGDAFDRKSGIRVRAVHPMGRDAVIDLRYRYDDISEEDAQFAGIAGDRRQYDVRYRWYRDHHRIQLRAALESNSRVDPGVSPDRRRFGLDYRYQPARGFGVEAGLEFRASDYDGLVVSRDEDLTSISVALTYAFDRGWTAILEYRNGSNESTDPQFAYDRNRVTLGVLKYF